MNRKVYKTPEKKIDAMRQAIELRQKWENAIREGLSREEKRWRRSVYSHLKF